MGWRHRLRRSSVASVAFLFCSLGVSFALSNHIVNADDETAGIPMVRAIDVKFTDSYGTTISTPIQGNQATITYSYNLENARQTYVSVLQISDKDDVITYLAWQSGRTDTKNQTITAGMLWPPGLEGQYSARIFFISDWEEPQILSPILESEIAIVADSTAISPYWVTMNTTQCADIWYKARMEAFAGKQTITNEEEVDFYKRFFYDNYSVTINDIRIKSWVKEVYGTDEFATCAACHCTSGNTLSLLVPYADVHKMTVLGFAIL